MSTAVAEFGSARPDTDATSFVSLRSPVGVALIAGTVLASGVGSYDAYVVNIAVPALLRGIGLGLTVAPLTAAVLAAVSDCDLGEASAINDTAARVGAVVAIALVPLLIGIGAGSGLEQALTGGYETAMLVIAGVCAAAAVVAWLFVSDEPAAAPRLAPPAPDRGCALPVGEAGAAS